MDVLLIRMSGIHDLTLLRLRSVRCVTVHSQWKRIAFCVEKKERERRNGQRGRGRVHEQSDKERWVKLSWLMSKHPLVSASTCNSNRVDEWSRYICTQKLVHMHLDCERWEARATQKDTTWERERERKRGRGTRTRGGRHWWQVRNSETAPNWKTYSSQTNSFSSGVSHFSLLYHSSNQPD